ncbi:hypothetical protein LINGRAHAP2_LOCUS19902 [Linum grandiflorum]
MFDLKLLSPQEVKSIMSKMNRSLASFDEFVTKKIPCSVIAAYELRDASPTLPKTRIANSLGVLIINLRETRVVVTSSGLTKKWLPLPRN